MQKFKEFLSSLYVVVSTLLMVVIKVLGIALGIVAIFGIYLVLLSVFPDLHQLHQLK